MLFCFITLADSVLAVEIDCRRLGLSPRVAGARVSNPWPKLACATTDRLTLAIPWTWPPSVGKAAPAAMTSGPSQSSSSHFNFVHSPTNPCDARRPRFPRAAGQIVQIHTRARGKNAPSCEYTNAGNSLWTHTPPHMDPSRPSVPLSLCQQWLIQSPCLCFLFCPVHRSGLWHSRPFCFFFFFF